MFSGGLGHFIEGIVFIITGAIFARIGAELVMVFFKLHEQMQEVAENTSAGPVKTSTARKDVKKVVVKSKKTSEEDG